MANGRTATVGTPKRAAGADSDDATVAVGLPAAKYQAPAPPTAMQRRKSGHGRDEPASRCRLPLAHYGRLADLDRIGPHRFGDVFQRHRTEIADIQIEPRLDLPIGVLREADRAGLGDAFEARGDIDAVAHQVPVLLLDDVAEMDADAEFDALVLRHARVALRHRVLHFDRAADRVDHAAELDDRAVAGALDHPAFVNGDGGIDEIAAQSPEPRERPVLVGAREPAEADHVGGEDRRELARLGRHGAPQAGEQQTFVVAAAE